MITRFSPGTDTNFRTSQTHRGLRGTPFGRVSNETAIGEMTGKWPINRYISERIEAISRADNGSVGHGLNGSTYLGHASVSVTH